MTLFKGAVFIFLILSIIKLFRKLNGSSKPDKNPSSAFNTKKDSHDTFNWDKPKRPSLSGLFRRKDVDCELDERIFGPKNKNKDIF